MKLNKDLLKDLYMIDHESGGEHKMLSFIINYAKKIPNITFELDHYSNLFITKNTTNPDLYPCIIAHTDQVVTNKGAYKIVEEGNIMKGAHYLGNAPCSLGADDANGICVALQLLEVLPDLKCIFTVEEECGAVGAIQAAFNADFLYNVRYFLQADRRGNKDLIVHTNCIDVVTEEFLNDLKPIMVKFGYETNSGTLTDVGEIVEKTGICGVNISCGYYKEHTINEYTNLLDLENCINFVYDIILTLPEKQYEIDVRSFHKSYNIYYDFEWKPAKLETESPSESDKMYDFWKEETIPCDFCRDFDCKSCKFANDY